MSRYPPLKERLYAGLSSTDPSQCWLWTKARSYGGYGKIYGNGRLNDTHRVSYELHIGPIPAGLMVLHSCDNPACCNPAHLWTGTAADNMRDKAAKGRSLRGPCSYKEWWTPERRAERAKVNAKWQRQKKIARQIAAGADANSKFCPGCKTWLSRTVFGPNKARYDGLAPRCKPCRRK